MAVHGKTANRVCGAPVSASSRKANQLLRAQTGGKLLADGVVAARKVIARTLEELEEGCKYEWSELDGLFCVEWSRFSASW
jgi:hypothetical protein